MASITHQLHAFPEVLRRHRRRATWADRTVVARPAFRVSRKLPAAWRCRTCCTSSEEPRFRAAVATCHARQAARFSVNSASTGSGWLMFGACWRRQPEMKVAMSAVARSWPIRCAAIQAATRAASGKSPARNRMPSWRTSSCVRAPVRAWVRADSSGVITPPPRATQSRVGFTDLPAPAPAVRVGVVTPGPPR